MSAASKRLALAGAAFAAILLAVSCTTFSGRTTAARRIVTRVECPDHADVPGSAEVPISPNAELALSGAITSIPEFHDCQRFLDANDHQYGPLIAIFARDGLESLYAQRGVELAAAEIYSFDARYSPLGIEQGFNCLYMVEDSKGAWRASIEPVQSDSSCLAPRDTTVSRTLTVVQSPADDFKASDIPPVARWERSPNGIYHIGIRCNDRWCNVGPSGGFTPETALTVDRSATNGEQRVRRIAGWYDDQRLSRPDSGHNIPKPSLAHGWIIPLPDIETYTESTYDSGYVTVANVILDKRDDVYKKKLNLDRGTNWLSLHKDSATGDWSAKITSAAGDSAFFRVVRRGHEHILKTRPNFRVPGAPRWRWHPDDETIWTPCLVGCCEVQSGGFSSAAALTMGS